MNIKTRQNKPLECKSCHHRKWIPKTHPIHSGTVACDMTGKELTDAQARTGGKHPECPLCHD